MLFATLHVQSSALFAKKVQCLLQSLRCTCKALTKLVRCTYGASPLVCKLCKRFVRMWQSETIQRKLCSKCITFGMHRRCVQSSADAPTLHVQSSYKAELCTPYGLQVRYYKALLMHLQSFALHVQRSKAT